MKSKAHQERGETATRDRLSAPHLAISVEARRPRLFFHRSYGVFTKTTDLSVRLKVTGPLQGDKTMELIAIQFTSSPLRKCAKRRGGHRRRKSFLRPTAFGTS